METSDYITIKKIDFDRVIVVSFHYLGFSKSYAFETYRYHETSNTVFDLMTDLQIKKEIAIAKSQLLSSYFSSGKKPDRFH